MAKHLINLDISLSGLRRARLSNSILADALNMPIKDNGVGTIYMGNVIEHSWYGFRMIKEAYRVLKPGGTIILTTPNAYYWFRFWLYCTNRGNCLGDNDHKIIYCRDSIRLMLETAGFADIRFAFKGRTGLLSPQIIAQGTKPNLKSSYYQPGWPTNSQKYFLKTA